MVKYYTDDELQGIYWVLEQESFPEAIRTLTVNGLHFTKTEVIKYIYYLLSGKNLKIRYRDTDHL